MAGKAHFSPAFFRFLLKLRDNNNREWFTENKRRFESDVRDPFLQFINDFAPLLQGISPQFVADPSPTGGSLFRIYRDTRFSKDKSPYKTHMAAHFSHVAAGKETPAPGFYLSLSPGECYGGAGLWHPDAHTLGRIRDAIVQNPDEWSKVRTGLSAEHDKLSRPPKGYNPNHPFIEDLKLRDFVMGESFTESQVCSSTFVSDFTGACRKMAPFTRFLTTTVGLPW